MSQKPRGPLQHRPELIAQSVAYVDCPYCDGENVLRKIEPSCSESNGREECETACKHCQSLFAVLKGNVRIRDSREAPGRNTAG